MKFDLVSDLHVEMNTAWKNDKSHDGVSNIYPWHLSKNSDILVVAGDCANDPYTALGVIDEAKQFYDRVLFIDGNHDHYNGRGKPDETVGANCRLYHRYANDNNGVHFLHPSSSSVKIDNTLFVGCNGWYDWTAYNLASKAQQQALWNTSMSDSMMISFDDPPDVMAQEHAGGIRKHIENAQSDDSIDNIVVVTHTIPHRKGLVPDSHHYGPLNGSFMNCLMEQVWIADTENKIKTWVFGHTHFKYDFIAEGIRFVTNPRGYKAEDRSFSYQGAILIDTNDSGFMAPVDNP